MRRLLVPGLLLALVMGCDTGTPEPTLYAPDDLASVLPNQVGDLTLRVEGSGGSEYLTEALGDAFLESILKADHGIGYDPGAMATSDGLGVTNEDWMAALPTCQRKGKENLELCRAPS